MVPISFDIIISIEKIFFLKKETDLLIGEKEKLCKRSAID